MFSKSRSFKYPVLSKPSSIRICIVHRGSRGDPIDCTIRVPSREEESEYEAVSYVWTDEADTQSISCNGFRMPVRPNMWNALNHLRQIDRPRTLWFDRLCIDQENEVEKGKQVAMMDKIFSRALKVIVWLGLPPPGDGLPLALTHLICDNIMGPAYAEDVPMEKKIQGLDSQQLLQRYGLPLPDSEDWRIVDRLLHNAWFTRSWTFQEVLLARKVTLHYGPEKMPFNADWDEHQFYSFEILLLAVLAFAKRPLRGPRKFYTSPMAMSFAYSIFQNQAYRAQAERSRTKYADRSTLLVLLLDRKFCNATDPRDKIYALLSVASDRKDLGIARRYDIPTSEVYLGVARRMIKCYGLLSLGCVENPIENPDVLIPSWVPDWTRFMRDGLEIGNLLKRQAMESLG